MCIAFYVTLDVHFYAYWSHMFVKTIKMYYLWMQSVLTVTCACEKVSPYSLKISLDVVNNLAC